MCLCQLGQRMLEAEDACSGLRSCDLSVCASCVQAPAHLQCLAGLLVTLLPPARITCFDNSCTTVMSTIVLLYCLQLEWRAMRMCIVKVNSQSAPAACLANCGSQHDMNSACISFLSVSFLYLPAPASTSQLGNCCNDTCQVATLVSLPGSPTYQSS